MYNEREMHTAINAADDALLALRDAESRLSSAGNWGIWDMLGGMISTFFKHSKINQAQESLDEARSRLYIFRNELEDLGKAADFDLDISDFLRFADYFFDDFFSDWMVQSKIRKGQKKIQKAIRQVENIRRQLWAALNRD